jgi:hypothetical protein
MIGKFIKAWKKIQKNHNPTTPFQKQQINPKINKQNQQTKSTNKKNYPKNKFPKNCLENNNYI